MARYDIAIIGAGIAGASLAAVVAPHASIVILESEERPGFHATGRSAAFWSETYGGPHVQPLTSASGDALSAGGFLDPLGALQIGRRDDAAKIDAFLAEFEGSGVILDAVDPHGIVPGLRAEWTLGVLERSCAYIDVAGLHAAFLATARRHGGQLLLGSAMRGAVRAGDLWRIDIGNDEPVAATILVDAAGAWADQVAACAGVAPLGISPFRRTMVQLRTNPAPPEKLPLVSDIGGTFYFKPEAGGRLWLSPHDEITAEPGDAQPEEIDIAIAIDRFERVVDWQVERVEHRWAGLRSFAPDRLPVYGFDPTAPGFFWCAGQGGFGIQTAPAAAALAASLLLGVSPEAFVAAIDPMRYAPDRFRSLA
ncbi:FAD-dependent oxidoreductase [Sphingomonas sp. AR_OL41]|uniref:NAD(P)/FAD-dependent oxidoreductase n=1 Tax=Sphingomonas sp. AR_OL41 TaxID=3042729 RepID=UPI00247FCEE0|nr:FAD-dependent oxidoreductase [Sphingomonas sp. AR_OL41]MDH7971662.1 FAD-dependent oxidoreductase [Sphingomonas sp. AR_OL41]